MENNDEMKKNVEENFVIIDPQPCWKNFAQDPQPRWKSWAVWVSMLGALWTIANAVGLTEKWGIEETTFKTVVDAIGVILVGFGILNNPTDRSNF